MSVSLIPIGDYPKKVIMKWNHTRLQKRKESFDLERVASMFACISIR